jgi:mono/diheme cytochrome c family protein
MAKTTLPLRAGLAAALALFANSLLAQNTSTPPPPPPPPPAPVASSNTTAAPKPAAKAGPKVDKSKIPPASDKKDVSFDKDIEPFLKASCSDCHGTTKPRAGYTVLTAATVLKDSKGHAMIVPGHSDNSTIVWYVSDAVARKEMPPVDERNKSPALTKEQIGLLRAWIDQGAKG